MSVPTGVMSNLNVRSLLLSGHFLGGAPVFSFSFCHGVEERCLFVCAGGGISKTHVGNKRPGQV